MAIIDPLFGLNLLQIIWICLILYTMIAGSIVLRWDEKLPDALRACFRYGKTATQKRKQNANNPPPLLRRISTMSSIEIPKRWFGHFYMFATMFYGLLLWSLYLVYIEGEPVPGVIEFLLDIVAGARRRATGSVESVSLAMFLLFGQVSRRLFECLFLSIFSETKIKFGHYFLGFFFYCAVGLSLLSEAPLFSSLPVPTMLQAAPIDSQAIVPHSTLSFDTENFVCMRHFIGTAIFIWAYGLQCRTNWLMAELRRDKHGQTSTYQHTIPRGFGFEYVSCPHYLAEIVIYLSMSTILGGSSLTWWLVCCFVLVNQIITGLMVHRWYLANFPNDYPAHRKAVIPLII